MERIKRKRVTRVGSGAYSIYLPKKWIDGWSEEQAKEREVDLLEVSGGILILPAIQQSTYETEIVDDPDVVTRRLLSAYVRGHHRVRLRPLEGSFDGETVTAARDLLRHLDERLVALCTPTGVGYDLDPDLPPSAGTGSALIAVMGAKVREVLRLAADALETQPHDPGRTLHALALLRSIHEEDVDRYFHQALRLVATIDLPMDTVSDFQVLDLTAADLHALSQQGLRIADLLLRGYGLTVKDLAYPRDHLLERLTLPPPPGAVSKELRSAYRRAFHDLDAVLADLVEALTSGDASRLATIRDRIHVVPDRMQERIFQAVLENWGKETDEVKARSTFTMYTMSLPLAGIFEGMELLCDHGLALLCAAGAAT